MGLKKLVRFGFGALFALTFLSANAQDGERTSLDLQGSPIKALATNPAGTLILAASESPIGLHYTTSFGGEWATAFGGLYTGGTVQKVALTSEAAFITVNNQILRSSLPEGETWTPDWAADENIADSATSMMASGKFLIYVSSSTVFVYDTESNTQVDSLEGPGGFSIAKTEVGNDALYIGAGGQNGNALQRTTFDPSTGALGAAWTDLAGANGLPMGTEMGNFFVNPEDGVVFRGERDSSGENFVDSLYMSTDDGLNYSDTGVASRPNAMCFHGDVIFAGLSLSTDGGTTFSAIERPGAHLDQGRFEDQGCLINPTNDEVAYQRTNEGVDLASNVKTNSGTPTWEHASTGLTGTLVYSISQANDDPERAVLGTSAGVAVSLNFTADDISWIYPICPGNDCVGGGNVRLDPADSSIIYYGSGNIRKGIIDTSGEEPTVEFTNWGSKPSDTVQYSVFGTYAELPDYLVAGFVRTEGMIDGGLYFYDKNNPSTPIHSGDLDGKPISAFLPLSDQVMFAGVGVNMEEDADLRGIYRSTDGGLNWTKMSDTDLPSLLLVENFGYDSTNDVLYAAASTEDGNPTVFRLPDALASGEDWGLPETGFEGVDAGSVSDVVVDPDDASVYAGVSNQIWLSSDQGLNWELYFTGVSGESTEDLAAVEESDAASSQFGALANTHSIIQASSAGVFRLGSSVNSRCTLRVAKECRQRVRSRAQCALRVRLTDDDTGEGLEGSFQLQKRRNAKFDWKDMGSARQTNAKGKGKKKIRPRRTMQYRAEFSSPSCTTDTRRIRVQR